MKPAEWAAKWRIGFAGLDEIFAEAMAQARAKALEAAAQYALRQSAWKTYADLAEGIRSLAAAPSGDAKGTK